MRSVVLACLFIAAAPAARAEHLEASPRDGRIVVTVYKAGLLSGFAHDHHFQVTDWRATAELPGGDPVHAAVEVVFAAGSLHDTQERLSASDRRKVDSLAAGPDVLDAAHEPRIQFRSERIELAPSAGRADAFHGTLHGALTIRGRSVPTDVPLEVERTSAAWSVRGTARVKQSDFGIKPYSGFGGTVKVRDEMAVEIAFSLRPSGP